jgi:RHS repeat-associated protein
VTYSCSTASPLSLPRPAGVGAHHHRRGWRGAAAGGLPPVRRRVRRHRPTDPRGWIGERLDPTGLQFLNARYYDPQLGLFLTPDWFPVTAPGVGTKRYACAGGDPVNLRDPGGNCFGVVCAYLADRYSGQEGLTNLGSDAQAAANFLVPGLEAGTNAVGAAWQGNWSDARQQFGTAATEVGVAAAGGYVVGRLWKPAMGVLGSAATRIERYFSTSILSAAEIRFRQSSVTHRVHDYAARMREEGWFGDPIDVVRMPDGGLTSVDNRRLAAAAMTDTPVQARIRSFDELITGGDLDRTTATTWGGFVLHRIGRQNPRSWPQMNPFGTSQMPRMPSAQ